MSTWTVVLLCVGCLMVGAVIGLFVAALCQSASDADEYLERWG